MHSVTSITILNRARRRGLGSTNGRDWLFTESDIPLLKTEGRRGRIPKKATGGRVVVRNWCGDCWALMDFEYNKNDGKFYCTGSLMFEGESGKEIGRR